MRRSRWGLHKQALPHLGDASLCSSFLTKQSFGSTSPMQRPTSAAETTPSASVNGCCPRGSAVLNRGGFKDRLYKGPPQGGYFTVFKFPDGTTLRVDIAHATTSGGGGDMSIDVSKWVLSKGSEVLMEGSFNDLLYKGQPR